MVLDGVVGAAGQQLGDDCRRVGAGESVRPENQSTREFAAQTLQQYPAGDPCLPPSPAPLTCPLVAVLLVRLDDDRVLPLAEGVLLHLGVQLVAPPAQRQVRNEGRYLVQMRVGRRVLASAALRGTVPTPLQHPPSLRTPEAAALAGPAADAIGDDGPVLGPILLDQLAQQLVLLRRRRSRQRSPAGWWGDSRPAGGLQHSRTTTHVNPASFRDVSSPLASRLHAVGAR